MANKAPKIPFPDDTLLTPRDVAKIMNYKSVVTARRKMQEPDFPSVNTGSGDKKPRLKVSRQDLQDYLKNKGKGAK